MGELSLRCETTELMEHRVEAHVLRTGEETMEKWIVVNIIGLALTLSGCGQQSSPEGLDPEPIVQLDPAVKRELTRQLEQRVELLAGRTRTYLTCRPKSKYLTNDLGDVYQKWEVRLKEPVEAKLTYFRQKSGAPTKYVAFVDIQIEKRKSPVSMTREDATTSELGEWEEECDSLWATWVDGEWKFRQPYSPDSLVAGKVGDQFDQRPRDQSGTPRGNFSYWEEILEQNF